MKQRKILHLLDDVAMGGVTRALKNFEHPALQACGTHETLDITKNDAKAQSPHDIAVVHYTANWAKLRHLAGLKLRGGFKRVILIEHTYTEGFQTHEVSSPRRFHLMLRLAYSLVDQVVAVSHEQRRWMLDNRLPSADKIIAIPQSRDCADLIDLPYSTRTGEPLKIGAFGRFHRQKGFDLLLDAMTRVSPEVAELKLAGKGELSEAFARQASKVSSIEILPAFSSPAEFLSSVDVVAIPSRWEAFGLVGTEARAAGRPIIVSDVDGLRDQAGAHAFTHRVGDVQDIVRAIQLAASATDMTQRAVAARKSAIMEYEAMIAGWEKVLAA